MAISLAPYVMTNSQESFLLQTDGFVQGVFLDDPALRYQLEGGVVVSTQTIPLWGGLPISLAVVAPGAGGASSGLGQVIAAATAEGNIDGWCVFNQASAGVITPSSPVPLFSASTSANFIRAGCGLSLVLPVNPTAVNTIAGGASNQAIYWDYTNNRVDTSGTGALGLQILALNTNSKTVTYTSGTGFATWNNAGSVIVVRV
jgi:hypothetical protein